jgi:hypothetical protein
MTETNVFVNSERYYKNIKYVTEKVSLAAMILNYIILNIRQGTVYSNWEFL